MNMNSDQLYKVTRILENGTYGSFFSAIGCAYQLADADNKLKLLNAFGDDFQRIYSNYADAMNLENSEL